ncbi:MAG: hypothetical protein GY820_08315 [Gammaproteobacteria bacterium]|nr:hypothetical protein [Gammaproteobacteria bacterium]
MGSVNVVPQKRQKRVMVFANTIIPSIEKSSKDGANFPSLFFSFQTGCCSTLFPLPDQEEEEEREEGQYSQLYSTTRTTPSSSSSSSPSFLSSNSRTTTRRRNNNNHHHNHNNQSAVASVCFHPIWRQLVAATGSRLVFWDWKEVNAEKIANCPQHERIRRGASYEFIL